MITEKQVHTIRGYVYEGGNAPEKYLQYGVPASKLREQASEGMTWACEHKIDMARDAPEDIMMDLRANFEGEYSEVGVYLTISRVAYRGDYPEISIYWARVAFEEAEHAAEFVELLGEVVTSSAKKNLEMGVTAENGITVGRFNLTKRAKALSLDTIHDAVHEMAKNETRCGEAFEGLLSKYFG